MLKRLLVGGPGGATPVADVGLLLLRAAFGLFLAFGHGWSKLPPPEQMVKGVPNLHLFGVEALAIPEPLGPAFAWAAAASEFLGGILLALGLLTRPAALMIVATMTMAAFGAHWADPLFMSSAAGAGSKQPALMFLVPALTVMLTGSGRYGVDALFWRSGAERAGFPVVMKD